MIRSAGARLAALLLILGSSAAPAQPDLGEEDLDDLRNARDLLIRIEDYAGALAPATAIVEALEDNDDPLLGPELLRLARIQAGLREYDAAEEAYLHAIELIMANDGVNSAALVNAHQGLGRTYLNTRRFEEALVELDTARTISRRVGGLFNIGQSTIIDDLTLAYLGLGNTTDALDLQQTRLDNAMRRFDADDARLIPFHAHFGDYLDNSRLRVAAREQYARALELSEASFGSASPETLALLRRIAEIDLLLDADNDVAAELSDTLRQLPDLDPLERARTLATLGDCALVYEGAPAAAPHYAQAYHVLEAVEGVEAPAFFHNPKPLNLIPPLSRVDEGTRRDPWSWGELTLEFDVSADGRAGNVRTVGMNPEDDDVAADYSRRIRETIFRPRIVDGVPVSTADVRYSHSFRFYVRD